MLPSFHSGILLFCIVAVLSLHAMERPRKRAPRGQPIRPAAAPADSTNAITQNIVRLPGGVLLTNIPGEFLPADSRQVRLPSVAARKFEPLGYTATSFAVLSRFFPKTSFVEGASAEDRWEELRKQIPEDVLALDGKKVALVGFTLPLTLVDGRATEFLLLRTQSACCFGQVPRVNEYVYVKMPKGMKPELDRPTIVGGILSVKWMGEGDELAGLYELHADRIELVP